MSWFVYLRIHRTHSPPNFSHVTLFICRLAARWRLPEQKPEYLNFPPPPPPRTHSFPSPCLASEIIYRAEHLAAGLRRARRLFDVVISAAPKGLPAASVFKSFCASDLRLRPVFRQVRSFPPSDVFKRKRRVEGGFAGGGALIIPYPPGAAAMGRKKICTLKSLPTVAIQRDLSAGARFDNHLFGERMEG